MAKADDRGDPEASAPRTRRAFLTHLAQEGPI